HQGTHSGALCVFASLREILSQKGLTQRRGGAEQKKKLKRTMVLSTLSSSCPCPPGHSFRRTLRLCVRSVTGRAEGLVDSWFSSSEIKQSSSQSMGVVSRCNDCRASRV